MINLVLIFMNTLTPNFKSLTQMNKLFLISTLLFTSHGLFAQQGILTASARKDSTGIFIGDMRATEQVESAGVARKFAMTILIVFI